MLLSGSPKPNINSFCVRVYYRPTKKNICTFVYNSVCLCLCAVSVKIPKKFYCSNCLCLYAPVNAFVIHAFTEGKSQMHREDLDNGFVVIK